MASTTNSDTNQSIEKAVALMRHLADHPGDSSVGALARATDMPRPTASRLLRPLEGAGLLVRDPASDRFAFGRLAARLGRAADPRHSLVALGTPVLQRLARRSGESAYLTLVVDGTGLYVAAVEMTTSIIGASVDRWLGEQDFALHATSNGKVLLADLGPEQAHALSPTLERCTPQTITSWKRLDSELRDVRAAGYAITRDELEDGLTSVSAPIHDNDGGLTAILSVIGPSFRFSGDLLDRVIHELRARATDFTGLLA